MGVELLIAQIVESHPEYHRFLEDEDSLSTEFTVDNGQTNPFLHMGMHITLGEQLQSDRPAGIRTLYQRMTLRAGGDTHEAEHRMMECLGVVLWEAQRAGKEPDEQAYLDCIKKLAG